MAKRVIITKKRETGLSELQGFRFDRSDVELLARSNGRNGSYRLDAWDTFQATPMPVNTDEAWRRTDIRRLETGPYKLPQPDAYLDLQPVPAGLSAPLAEGTHEGRLTLLPGGQIEVDLDKDLKDRGVVFTSLRSAETGHTDLLAEIRGRIVPASDGKFAALSSALAGNGVLVYIPDGVEVTAPLHSLLWGPGADLAHFSHLIIWLGNGSSLTYVHESASPSDSPGKSMHGGVVEILVGDRANLRFVNLQSWGQHVWNFTHERARIGRDSHIDWIFGGMGTGLTKSFMDLDLAGEGASGRMSGFYFTNGSQHLDLDTQQNHLVPNTTSDLLYKGALKDHSRVVWQGMIFVAPGAQKTDGFQANRNLVLDAHARADSIPGLEIQADDVRCTHGATVGKIDPELLFYLRSRGVPDHTARRLVVEGFFQPIMERIPFQGVRDRFQDAILYRMEKG
jgi:Fe-S cluster assembly protein SufD